MLLHDVIVGFFEAFSYSFSQMLDELSQQLESDTRFRFSSGETSLPEPENLIAPCVQEVITNCQAEVS